ncbi:MAG TPA: DUF4054 domain-containing protein [Agrobacterium sp.]|uniref:DUF4054 domain-containing protein n=1 Tax=Agrobacterium pusense TaxID=648995 RepID=UPI000E97143B|nr:DUF4054 domain-containing protein [Agrobacterium sp.]
MADAAGFRTAFPEFSDTNAYPDATVNLWLGYAQNLVNLDRWGTLYDLGVYLLTAHNLVIWKKDSKAASVGGIPGSSSGVQSSKAVDGVSVSYDTTVATVEGAGNLNLTTYGTRFADLRDMFGAGGFQL